MADDAAHTTRKRKRAFKACQRCNSRKVKCDAAQTGVPCSRCRVDGAQRCEFINSRRGKYDRRRSKSKTMPVNVSPSVIGRDPGTAQHRADHHAVSETTPSPISPEPNTAAGHTSLGTSPAQGINTRSLTVVEEPGPSRSNSLALMFENFLKQQGRDSECLVGKYGLVLMGDSSPLTFALKELQPEKRAKPTAPYDGSVASPEIREQERSPRHHRSTSHPSHLATADIAYLKAKGAFTTPTPECLNALIETFIEKFYPLYSIVNKSEFLKQYQSGSLPWILLQAACLIGATYCEIGVIKTGGFKTRQSARRFFYDKAKVLYDVGYETNSVVLLQAIIILTFWGPDMKSYWNPCSWVGVAVTIAESLALHRSTGFSMSHHRNQGLLRRIWWTIAVRDAYCGTLLGRPFRVNMGHCDADMLTVDDFDGDDESPGSQPSSQNDPRHLSTLYQIALAKLSLILRQIINVRFNVGFSATPQSLHEMLRCWRAELPSAINWPDHGSPSTSIFSESLKILFHHHLIFVYLSRREAVQSNAIFNGDDGDYNYIDSDPETSEIAESAAQTIASTSVHLMTKSLVRSLPQEVFLAFFVAGIVFFRFMKRSQSQPHKQLIARLGQAALDHCRIVLNEVGNCWEPAFWGMRIFDFLLAGIRKSGAAESNEASSSAAEQHQQMSAVSTGSTAADTTPSATTGPGTDTNAMYDNMMNPPDCFALQNTFEMGPAIHDLCNAAQQRQLDMNLTTQLYDRFQDPKNYFMMPTAMSFGTPNSGGGGYDHFDMSQW
ncbi:uncharacterized protein Z518_04541 [Rhinocladiella mackenziei CBS 650.93]|uniref:Zn(2)-C6 fungal-type domain-containing protein n=1 Tax=Rhinocladiella mackenziei CBS 650.93 TaxID=1442369 RepID=A0A0D2JBU6_9EURO|nr:uncharacterized protein Z518_04541 [Rhinocladiella mackenziei CBS 650.93]KIX06565.1 hypothetical protein Z518_04541 [Rhinocladiella mackenziei CBS 650.93]